MAEPGPQHHPARKRRRGRRRRKWLLKFSAWLLLMLVVGSCLVAAVGFVAYQQRVALVNRALDRLADPYFAEVESVDFEKLGLVVVKGVTLTPKEVDREIPLAYLDEVRITYNLGELRRSGRLRSIAIAAPVVHLDEKLFDALGFGGAGEKERDPDGEAAVPFDLKILDRFTRSFSAVGGRFALDLPWHPPVTGEWGFRSGPLRFDRKGLTRAPLVLDLEDLRFGEDEEAGRIPSLSLRARVNRDLSRIEVDELSAEEPFVAFSPAWLSPVGKEEEGRGGEEGKEVTEEFSATDPAGGERRDDDGKTSSFSLLIKQLSLKDSDLSCWGFDGEEGRALFPDIALVGSVDLRGIVLEEGKWSSRDGLRLNLEQFRLGADPEHLIDAEGLVLEADGLDELLEERRIRRIEASSFSFTLSDAALSRFARSEEAESGGDGVAGAADDDAEEAGGAEKGGGSGAPPSRPWRIDRARIDEGRFRMHRFREGRSALPRIDTRVEAVLREIAFGGEEGWASGQSQQLRLLDFSLGAPGTDLEAAPCIAFADAEVFLRPDRFKEDGRIDSARIERPALHLADASLGDWLPEVGTPENQGDAVGSGAAKPVRPVYAATDLRIVEGKVLVDTRTNKGRIPKLRSGFSLTTTEPESADKSPAYRLVLDDLHLRNHARLAEAKAGEDFVGPPVASVVEEEVISVGEVTVDFTAKEVQRDRRVERIRVEGAELNVGKGLKELAGSGEGEAEEKAEVQPEAPAPSPEAGQPLGAPSPSLASADGKALGTPASSPASAEGKEPGLGGEKEKDKDKDKEKEAEEDGADIAAPLPGWTVGEIEVTESRVRFDALIPQVEGLEFTIETQLTEVPLSLDGMLAQEEIQKVELAGIEIKDPYDSFITVAELPTIFVEFSLAGLGRQEIEKIDLVGPALHVGQGLFWWVDYQRNFREVNEGASVGVENLDEPGGEKPDWVIKTINASAGKIVIAPRGIPVGIVPFPFSATTNMEDGNISLNLNIPEEDFVYRFPDYQVELFGLRGDVDFNVPVESEDNNLVQTFRLRRGVWKEYEAEDLYLSVTFDEEGVYGSFGGKAYTGYVDGQFNYYLSGEGKKWDAWIAGSELDAKALTDIIVPENFRMDGPLSVSLVSEGSGLDLGETTGTFETLGPGMIDITKLDQLIDRLPGDWSQLKRSLSTVGLEALKRFEYDKGRGSLYLRGREGDLSLQLTGAHGSRELNIQFHDWRPPEDKGEKPGTSQAAVSP